MAIANITNNILTDSGVATSALQIALNGTGFVKIVGTTISYDNSTYLTTSAAASTYVALTGNQTIAGVKTFSNNSKFDGALILKNNVSSSLAGYVGLSALSFSGNKGINIDFDTYSIGFYFNGTLPYNYTFPNANGTVALTSDIPDVSGYVTLITAQTITGAKTFTSALNGTSAVFSSSVTASSFFESSDSRLKTLIQDNYQTKGIASITPKLYTKNGKVELGYYAQDFVGILDSAVSKGSDDMLSLSYREVLVAKVYALEQEIKELKAKMN
jgi:hypothetical protein